MTNYLTKFRAFQLDTPGSLFSFFKPNYYTLIEARLPIGGFEVLKQDLSFHGKDRIDKLHITSWDTDHCTFNDLTQILNHFRPAVIEVPSYEPRSDDGRLCKKILFRYDDIHQRYVHNVLQITKEYIAGLPHAPQRGEIDVVYPSRYGVDNKNDMSLIRLFRSAGFNVVSFGDCESKEIAMELILPGSIMTREVDVLILPHHGANNGFTCPELLDAIRPQIAVCSANYGNHYDHPTPEVCSLLSNRNIPLMTTKRGDVIIYQTDTMDGAVAVNMASNNEVVETRKGFVPKRMKAS